MAAVDATDPCKHLFKQWREIQEIDRVAVEMLIASRVFLLSAAISTWPVGWSWWLVATWVPGLALEIARLFLLKRATALRALHALGSER